MTRKRVLIVLCGLLALIALSLKSAWWATQQPPEFYVQVERQVQNPVVRKQVAREFTERTQQLVEVIRQSDNWSDQFTDAQINAWLIEEFPRQFADWIPPGLSEPRIHLQKGSLLVGFKYEQPEQWTGVVSLEVRAWVPAPNQLAIQITSIKAGLVPIPLEAIIEQVVQRASDSGADITWRDNDSGKVAIITLAPIGEGQPELETIELTEGLLRVTGSSKPDSGAFQFEPVRIAERRN